MTSKKANFEGYERIKTIGKGAFGTAVLYKRLSDNKDVVIKEIFLSEMSQPEKELAFNEAEVLSSLNHHNIIRYPQIPSSPTMEITKTDWTQFRDKTMKQYGVSHPTIEEEKKMLQRERKHLIDELSIPLNHSGGKYMHMGLDPFQDCIPVLRIYKEDVKSGVQFNENEFNLLMTFLPKILNELIRGEFTKCLLDKYSIMHTQSNCVKFVPQDNTHENFELYITVPTLRKLIEMDQVILQKFTMLNKRTCSYGVFCNDVALALNNTNTPLDISILLSILNKLHGGDHLLGEMVFKHTNFLFKEIQQMLDNFVNYNNYV